MNDYIIAVLLELKCGCIKEDSIKSAQMNKRCSVRTYEHFTEYNKDSWKFEIQTIFFCVYLGVCVCVCVCVCVLLHSPVSDMPFLLNSQQIYIN